MMRNWLAIWCVFFGVSHAVAADPVFGTWQSIRDDNGNYGHIRVAACGPKICGVLVRTFAADGREVVSDYQGRRIIWDMQPQGDGTYSGGKVWSPDRDKTYNARMRLSANGLSIEGCVLGICRDGGTWRRVD